MDTLQPTFAWQSFSELYEADPLAPDVALGGDDVTYDLRIFRAKPIPITSKTLGTGELVHEFRDIQGTSFKIVTPLEHCSAYTWTVRARFKLGDSVHLTHWSGNFAEKSIQKYREKQFQDDGMVRFNAQGASFLGQDQQYFYREDSYYFPFVAEDPEQKCRLKL